MIPDRTSLIELTAALIERLKVVFADVPRPFITHRVARALDDEWEVSQGRAMEVAALDPEQTWMEISDEAISLQ